MRVSESIPMNRVITIAREYGSGGREVGVRLSERLSLPFYDKELLKLVAEKGDLHEEFLEANEERPPQFLAPSFGRTMLETFYQPSFSDTIFFFHSRIIKSISENGPCIIVGRCADYILKERALKVYVYADMAFKIAHKHLVAPEKEGYSDEEMVKYIKSVEKERAKYYEHYTGYKKGMASNYDLCIRTDLVGIDGAVDLIAKVWEEIQ